MNTFWKTFWEDLAVSVLANLIAGIITVLIVFLVYRYIRRQQYFRVLSFFGISQESTKLTILCSRIIARHTEDTEVNQNAFIGTQGPVISFIELLGAQAIQSRLTGRVFPLFSVGIEGWLRGTLPSILSVKPTLNAAPYRNYQGIDDFPKRSERSEDHYFTGNTILLGSSVYNTLTELLENRGKLAAKFERDSLGVRHFSTPNHHLQPTRMPILDSTGQPKRDKYKNIEYADTSAEGALIQRLLINNHVVIVCAGSGSNATRQGAEFLSRNWASIEEQAKVKSREKASEPRAISRPRVIPFALYVYWYNLLPEAEEEYREPSNYKFISVNERSIGV
jgi:hypothetical protein